MLPVYFVPYILYLLSMRHRINGAKDDKDTNTQDLEEIRHKNKI